MRRCFPNAVRAEASPVAAAPLSIAVASSRRPAASSFAASCNWRSISRVETIPRKFRNFAESILARRAPRALARKTRRTTLRGLCVSLCPSWFRFFLLRVSARTSFVTALCRFEDLPRLRKTCEHAELNQSLDTLLVLHRDALAIERARRVAIAARHDVTRVQMKAAYRRGDVILFPPLIRKSPQRDVFGPERVEPAAGVMQDGLATAFGRLPLAAAPDKAVYAVRLHSGRR